MKNLFILSITLLASAPAVAMEGQWKQEETETPAAEHQQSSKVPSLENLCIKSFKTPKDPELLKKLPYIQHPNLTAGIWDNFPQELIDRDNDYYINLLLEGEYPAEVRAAMIKRLTLPEGLAQKLFDAALNPESDEEEHLIACALFAKNSILQTWENGQKVAELGPITFEAAKQIVQIINDYDLFYREKLPEKLLNFGNDQLFKLAFYDLISQPVSVTNQDFLSLKELPCPSISSLNISISNLLPTPIAHGYTIFTDESDIKSLKNENGNFVCYLPKMVNQITVSKDKKWCICCEESGVLTILDLQKKNIIATVPGMGYWAKQGLHFNENNQLFTIKTNAACAFLFDLPYSYFENTMSIEKIRRCILFKMIGGYLQAEMFN